MNRWVRLRVTTRVLKTIDKVGGLDSYVLGGGATRVKELGPEGWKLRWVVMNAARESGEVVTGLGERELRELGRVFGEVERVEGERRGEERLLEEMERVEGELRAEERETERRLEGEKEVEVHPMIREEGRDPGSVRARGLMGRVVDVVTAPLRMLRR